MIEATLRKLNEAKFFYGHLVRERQQKRFPDPSAFRYYFSAFIQAARSVTWRLGNEEPEKWKAWEPKWKANRTQEEQRLLDLTNDLRTDEVHHGGTDPSVELEEVALHKLVSANFDVDPWPIAAYAHHRRTLPGVPPSAAFRPAYYFEHEDGKEEVTALSKRYLDILDKMLNDFCADNQPSSPE